VHGVVKRTRSCSQQSRNLGAGICTLNQLVPTLSCFLSVGGVCTVLCAVRLICYNYRWTEIAKRVVTRNVDRRSSYTKLISVSLKLNSSEDANNYAIRMCQALAKLPGFVSGFFKVGRGRRQTSEMCADLWEKLDNYPREVLSESIGHRFEKSVSWNYKFVAKILAITPTFA
jgi:hypothetical protein